MHNLANSEDPDEMLHHAAFHQSLHCLLRQKLYLIERNTIYLEIITCDPSIYTRDLSKFIVWNQKEESISS